MAAAQAHLITYLYGSYLVLWIKSFSEFENGDSDGTVEMIYSRTTLVSIVPTFATLGLMGCLTDCIHPVYLITPAFLMRSLVCYTYKFVENPESKLAFALASLLLCSSTALVIGLESLFMKNLPRDVRGAMTVLLAFFLGLGALLYNGVVGPIFDGLGPTSPFKLVSIMDLALCIFALILGCTGRLNSTEPDVDAGSIEKRQNMGKDDKSGDM